MYMGVLYRFFIYKKNFTIIVTTKGPFPFPEFVLA
jgi:hypothetical protein